MKKTVLLLGLVIAAAVAVAAANPPLAEDKSSGREVEQLSKDLDARYQNWLNMITYITFKEERKVFLKMTNDRDRDAFIKIFWLQRDPTPGTPENEFKDEIEKRFAYVNDYFRRGTSRPGWMTDQGQIYMTLGKPSSLERFDDKMGLNPVQVWYYYGDAALGLPTYFNVVFYKRLGAGEWKLYNPSSDGPAQLLVQDNSIENNDYAAIYKKIREIAPTLAGPAMSMLPNDMPNNFQPSARNSFILANIYESPLKKLNVSYATNFLKYKGFVNLETSANFIENTHLVAISREERYDFNFVTMSIRPKKISLGYNEDKDKYYFNLNLNVSLRKGEKIIYQYAKNFEFYFEPDKVGELEGGGVAVHDSFPVIPGEYQLVVFIENTVGKEFTYFDQVVNVPPSGGLPYLATPVLGHKEVMENNNFFHPYRFFNKKLSVDPARTFSLNDTPLVAIGAYNLTREMWEKGVVELELKGLNERKKFSRTVNVPLREQPYAGSMNWVLPIDKSGLVSDYYELKLRLKNPAGIIVDSQNTDFTISPLQKLAHPIETFKQVLADSPSFFYSALGQQSEGAEDFEKAELFYEKSVAGNPDFAEGWVALLTIENKLHKYAQVLSRVEKLKESAKFTFNYHLIKGTALCGLEQFDPALDELLKANKIYNSDVRVLNLIGFTFFKLNNMAEALKAFAASLALNGKQPGIEKISAEIKKRIQKNPPDPSAAK